MARTPLALLLLACCVSRASARSAAARASASGSGGGGNSGVVTLVSTAVPGPLPPPLQAAADAVFASAGATLAGTPLLCGSIGSLQSGYTRTADLGDGFFRVLPSAAASIAAVLAVRARRVGARRGGCVARGAQRSGCSAAARVVRRALNTRTLPPGAGTSWQPGARALGRPGRRQRVPGQLHGAQRGRQRQARSARAYDTSQSAPDPRSLSFACSYAVGRVPSAISAQGPLVALQYAFDTWGWDCVLSGVIQTPDKMSALPFFTPTQRYTLALTSAKIVSAIGSRTPPLSAWSMPFESGIWAILGGVLVFSGGLMYSYERDSHSHDDYGPEYIHWSDRFGRGVYKATSNWTAVGSFIPTTPAGRLYSMTFAFVMLLMQSAYTANLAAFFTFTPPPTAKLSSIDKLIASGAPACVAGGDPVHAGWMASNYPEIVRIPTPGFGADVAAAVASGVCLAGIATDAELNFVLGPTGDPAGAWCALEVVESGMGFNMYAIPLNPTSAWAAPVALHGANMMLQTALSTGEYAVQAMTQFGGTRRPVCENKDSIYEQLTSTRAALAPLGTRQLGGIFFLQCCGLSVALCIYAVGHVTPLSKAWDAVRGITHDPGEDDPATSAEAGMKHDHRGRRIIPLSAMLNIERALELAVVQLNHVAQTHRELDVPSLMAAHGGGSAAAGPAARNAEIANGVPLAVKAKIERALAFGLHARGDLVLFDSASGAELMSLPFALPTPEALAIAYAHMPSGEARSFENVLVLYLKNSISERRKAARKLASGRPG